MPANSDVTAPAPRTCGSPSQGGYQFQRRSLGGLDGRERDMARLMNLLSYTKLSGALYAAETFPAGYHTIEIDRRLIRGQRHPKVRYERINYDFRGAVVLDIGCNQGGMLFEIADRIRHGVGIDYDHRMINAATAISSHKRASNLDFYVFDLEREDLAIIHDILPVPRVDIAFLLAVCKWISNWRAVIDFVADFSDALLFESTGSELDQGEQIAHLHARYARVELLSDCSHDDPAHPRKLLLCRNS